MEKSVVICAFKRSPMHFANKGDLAKERPELDLVLETSHEALGHIELADAVVIDGDHNYYTVHEELRLIA